MAGPRDDGAAVAPRMSVADELRAVNERLILSGLREQESLERVVRERRQLDALLGALHDGVVITDGDGRIVMVNDAARRALGLPSGVDLTEARAAALDQRRLDMTVLPSDEHPLARRRAARRSTTPRSCSVRAHGAVRRLMTSCTHTTDDGKVALSIAVLRDVTDRRTLEARLAQTEHLASIGTLAAGVFAVERRAGGGMVFRVVLPPSERAPEEAASPPRVPLRPARRGVVLVVDDEPAIGAALRRVLRDHDVTAVTSTQEALDLIATGRTFDIILSDLMMPGRSGMDLYESLRKCDPRHAERVVFVSGGAFTPGATAFLGRVTNERVAKPFDADAVRALVQRYVGRP